MSFAQSAVALVLASFLDDIILERYLINILPKNRQYPLQAIEKLTGYNFSSFHNYVHSELFAIHKTTFKITDDNQLLFENSKIYCENIIKKLVFPSKYKQNKYVYNIGKLFDFSCYTTEEKNFINLMSKKLFCMIYDDIDIKPLPSKDLLKFNSVNSNGFNYVARNVFNAIIQNKLHAGDSIMSYVKNKNDLAEKLANSSQFDYFFDNNAVLKCDLDTNLNILIKNFLNLCIYNFKDTVTKIILLVKLNSKYSFLIEDDINFKQTKVDE